MSSREILEEARRRLTGKTWIKYKFAAVRGEEIKGMCMHGACWLASGGKFVKNQDDILLKLSGNLDGPISPISPVLARIIREQFPERAGETIFDSWDAVINFNDHPKTTLEDVHLVLDKAIAEVS